MKKNTIVIAFFLIAALAAACVELLEPGVKASRGKYSLDLSVRCQDPATKATIEGVESLHENTLTRVDWFIFKSTSDNATAVLDGITSYEDISVTEPTLVASVDMEDYIDPSTKTFTGYVFLLANLPASNTHASLAALTLGELKQLQVSTTLDLLGTDGKFKAQDNFVMASSTAPLPSFSLSENSTTATVLAPLSRVAAKITLDISIVSAIDEITAQMSGRDTLAEEYLQTWYPDVNNIQVYLTYANQHTTIDRTLYGTEPFSYQDAYFFTYNRYGFKSTATKNDDNSWNVTGTPFYSYPMKWANSDAHAPFIKIILPWRPYVEDPTYNANYEYITHDGQGGKHVGNKLVSASREHIDDTSAATQEFFYKINLPLEDNTLSSNTWYKIALDVAILGGRTDDVSMELAGKYYVVDWNSPTFQAGGELTQGSYLSLATPRDTFYIYGGNSIEIPVKSSHSLAASITSRKAYLNGDWTTTPKTITQGGNTRTVPINLSSRGTVTANGRSSVTFTDDLTTMVGDNLDCYPMSFTIDIRHADSSSGLSKVETITVIQYPPIYVDQIAGGNAFIDGYYGNIGGYYHGSDGRTDRSRANDATNNTDIALTPYGQITQNGSLEPNMTVINISAFGGNVSYNIPGKTYPAGQTSEEYLIADPRQASGWQANDLTAYYNGTNTTDWTDEQAGSIMIGSTIHSNFIAPKLLVSSRWGRFGNWNNPGPGNDRYEVVQKRCATYQEAGYPAGRWRLPTEAEVMFMVNLQRYGFISNLFTSSRSLTASGSFISVTINNSQQITGISYGETPLANPGGNSCRCVYDLWYWGDDPVADPATTYTIGVE